ncbi:vWA domain-containing protein [Candidatus Magnetominusculus xianensis]|uniref:von Willebrand factor type A n=1 Tax=Candidatus Magnetominusculus xianensis TaxID=1748249 RepID=A0ABR5SBD8_9BACT|nr:VWA domain-containing protein [Candidatus Magnetominusculus xianensis]KWT76859.1 von Willebrand factor type A [Candidatus Magnetominusculus xianensis]MBF0402635.1 VWA domain-containing protein [Nitrospirota bacterium]
MRFGNLQAVHLLWAAAVMAVFYVIAFRLSKKALHRFAGAGLSDELTMGLSRTRQFYKAAMLIAAVFLCVAALMRPQWGFHLEEVRHRVSDILIAIDTSKSMLAADVKPNRLARSKFAVIDLIKKLRGDRIGLIGFAGKSFLFSPLTVDYNGFMLALNDLSVNSIPVGGTNIATAIDEALNIYKDNPSKDKTLILITDGEDLEGNALGAAQRAKDAGMRIYTVGIGTPEGELIQVTDEKGSAQFLRDSGGNMVKSRLDEGMLEKIALTTGGSYVKAGSAEVGLELIYDQKLSHADKQEMEEKMQRRYNEQFQYPLALALILLMIETLMPERKRTR